VGFQPSNHQTMSSSVRNPSKGLKGIEKDWNDRHLGTHLLRITILSGYPPVIELTQSKSPHVARAPQQHFATMSIKEARPGRVVRYGQVFNLDEG
jgi:hypothetical protein